MEKLKMDKDKVAQWMFYLGLTIELIILIIDKSAFINPIEGRLFQITFILFGIKVLLTKYSKEELAFIILFGVIGVLSYFVSDRNEIIRIVVFVAAGKNIQIKKMMKYVFGITLLGIMLLVILSLVGVLGQISMTAKFRYDLVETRYTLGLGHPNALHCMFWALITLVVYLYYKQINRKVLIGLLVLNIILYALTLSKAGVIITTFTIVLVWSMKFTEKLLSNNVVPVLAIIVVFGTFLFALGVGIYGINIPVFKMLDHFLTGRIEYSHTMGGIQTWELFASPENTLYFDVGVVRMFYWYGIIPAVTAFLGICMMLWYTFKNKEYGAFVMILSFAVYATVEAHAVSVYLARNYIILFLAPSWSNMLGFYLKKDTKVKL